MMFWLIFIAEQMEGNKSGGKSNGLLDYWKSFAVILFGCLSLIVFNICETQVHLQNPFNSIWLTDFGTYMALGFMIFMNILSILYFLYLCYRIKEVFVTISSKSTSSQHDKDVWISKFVMLATGFTAAFTVIYFIIGRMAEGAHKWDENLGETLEYISGLMTGVYGMWNIYTMGLLFLYAPSHKQWNIQV